MAWPDQYTHEQKLVVDDKESYQLLVSKGQTSCVLKLQGRITVGKSGYNFRFEKNGPHQVAWRDQKPAWDSNSCFVDVLIDVLMECELHTVKSTERYQIS